MRIRIKEVGEYSGQAQAILRQMELGKTEETLYHFKTNLSKALISNLEYP